jgi:hypothetical protein
VEEQTLLMNTPLTRQDVLSRWKVVSGHSHLPDAVT